MFVINKNFYKRNIYLYIIKYERMNNEKLKNKEYKNPV